MEIKLQIYVLNVIQDLKEYILIIIVIIFSYLLFSKTKKLKNVDKTQDTNNKTICKSGYYLPLDDPLTKNCKKCTVENCLECFGNKTSNICTKCNSNLKESYESDINRTIIACKLPCETGNEDKCLRCDNIRNECIGCNIGYKLVNGKCTLNYSFKAIYKQNSSNETINLINRGSIKEMIIDGQKIKNPSKDYSFKDIEIHEIYILINMEDYGNSLDNLFSDVNRMISISFTSLFNISKATSMKYFFASCSKLESIDLSNFNTKSVTNLENMFYDCSSLISIDLSNFDTRKVTSLNRMFSGCSSLKSINRSNFDTRNVINLNSMFWDCSSLTSIDLSNFDTKNVDTLRTMFFFCSSLKSIDLSNFDTRNVTNLEKMFLGCSSLTSIDLSNFNTNKVSDMNEIFYFCKNLKFINIANFSIKCLEYN